MTIAETVYLAGAIACFAVFAVTMLWVDAQSRAARRSLPR